MAKKKGISSIILIVLGVLTLLPLFLEFAYTNFSGGGESMKEGFKLFDLETEGADLEICWTITKIGAIVAAVAGVAIAALEIAKFLNIDLGAIEKIVGFVLAIAGILVLVCFLIFCIKNTQEMMGMKSFLSGAIGWYLSWIPAIIAGGIVSKGSKE